MSEQNWFFDHSHGSTERGGVPRTAPGAVAYRGTTATSLDSTYREFRRFSGPSRDSRGSL